MLFVCYLNILEPQVNSYIFKIAVAQNLFRQTPWPAGLDVCQEDDYLGENNKCS